MKFSGILVSDYYIQAVKVQLFFKRKNLMVILINLERLNASELSTKNINKIHEKAMKAVLVGYTCTFVGYILGHLISRKFLESRHTKFNDKLVYGNVYTLSQVKRGLHDVDLEIDEQTTKKKLVTHKNKL